MSSARRGVALVAIVALATACAPEGVLDGADIARAPLGAGTFEEVTGFGSNPGGLRMFRYVPPEEPAQAPLVVALHGCTQSAAAYRAAGWEELADELGFFVLYPEQQSENNPASCFNWGGDYGDFSTLERGRDENQSVREMIERMEADLSIDPERVFVTGQSAGAAMSLVMLATWPDLFAAGASIAGVPFRCPDSFADAFTCTTSGIDRSPGEWADRARLGHPSYGGSYPRLSVWHGTADYVVGLRNMEETVEQWTALHGIDAQADLEAEADGYPHREHRDASGRAVVEVYEITGAGHATFVEPASGCGQTGAYFDDVGICSARHIARFFGLVDGGPPPDGGGDGDDGGGGGGGGEANEDESCECGCRAAPDGAGGGPAALLFLLALVALVPSLRRR